MEPNRLQKILDFLKRELYLLGVEWKDTKDESLLHELHALVGAINELEVFLHGKRITTVLDIA